MLSQLLAAQNARQCFCLCYLCSAAFRVDFAGGVAHTAPASLDSLSSIKGLRVFAFVAGVAFLGSAVVYGLHLLLQLGSGRLMLGIRLIRSANAALKDINYTRMLPFVVCTALFLLGMYAYVVGKLTALSRRSCFLRRTVCITTGHRQAAYNAAKLCLVGEDCTCKLRQECGIWKYSTCQSRHEQAKILLLYTVMQSEPMTMPVHVA